MDHSHRIRSATRVAVVWLLAAIVWAAGGLSPVRACSTPVFRYAMYNWAPAPYYVFYFHHGQAAKQDEAVNKTLAGLSRADPPANVVFTAVDVSNKEEFGKLPGVVKKAYESNTDGRQPLHVVFCPWVLFSAWMAEQYAKPTTQADEDTEPGDEAGQTRDEIQPDTPEQSAAPAGEQDKDDAASEESQSGAAAETADPPDEQDPGNQTPQESQPVVAELFAGRLDQKKLEAMIDSPVRKQLAKSLAEGNAAVMLILTGPDQQANKQAEKVAGEVVAMAAGGEFGVPGGDDFPPDQFLPGPPSDTPSDTPSADDSPAEGAPQDDPSEALKLAVLKLSRTDPAEKWLVDSLLSVEPDLRESKFAKSPMVFAVYGRGRAMPPYLDKGITRDNLAECVMFLTGPCSCTVKDQNPGVELLIRRDWDEVAEAMAAKEEGYDGGPFGYQEFAPDESDDLTRASAADAPTETPSTDNPQQEADEPPDAQQNTREPEDPQLSVGREKSTQPSAEEPEWKPSADDLTPTGSGSDSYAMEQAGAISIWVALGVAVVLVAGLVLILRQRPT